MKRLFGISFLLLLLIGAGSAGYAYQWFNAPLTNETQGVWLAPGTGQKGIAATLSSTFGATRWHWLAALEASKRLYNNRVQAGEYDVALGLSPRDILKKLGSGQVVQHRLTLVEGWTSQQITAALNTNDVLSGAPIDALAEGSILPETYFFTRGTARAELLTRLQQKHAKALSELWENRAADAPLQTPEEAVVLASIIERETPKKSDNGLVSSVYSNRLRINMPLQADPTVVYAASNGSGDLGRPLSRADLRAPSPFNTYLNNGLPPAPICHPSIGALRAALNPERSEYFYFVADGTGGHAFGKTLDEHNRNVAKWRRIEAAGN
jgi:UPF0755 protein